MRHIPSLSHAIGRGKVREGVAYAKLVNRRITYVDVV